MNVLAQFADLLESLFRVRTRCGASGTEDSPLGLNPVSIARVMSEVSVAATADHATVVERHVVQVETLVFDLGIADGTRVSPSWDQTRRLSRLVFLGLFL